MRYSEKRGMRGGCSWNRRQLWNRAASRSRAGTRRPNRGRFQMALRIRQSVVKHALIARRDVCGLCDLKRKIAQHERQEQKCASMKQRGHCHLPCGESARANWHITKKFARDQRQMNWIAGKQGSQSRPQRGAKEVRSHQKLGLPRGRSSMARRGSSRHNSIQQTFRFEKPFSGGFAVKNHRTFQSEQTRVLAPTYICTTARISTDRYTRTRLSEMHEPFQP